MAEGLAVPDPSKAVSSILLPIVDDIILLQMRMVRIPVNKFTAPAEVFSDRCCLGRSGLPERSILT